MEPSNQDSYRKWPLKRQYVVVNEQKCRLAVETMIGYYVKTHQLGHPAAICRDAK